MYKFVSIDNLGIFHLKDEQGKDIYVNFSIEDLLKIHQIVSDITFDERIDKYLTEPEFK